MSASGQPPAEKEYWDRIQREAPLVAIHKSEEAAKQLMALASLLSTIYFGIIAFNDVLKQTVQGPSVLLFALPLPFWLGSLFFSIRVIVPRAYAIHQIQADYQLISQVKHKNLRWGYALLVASMLVLFIDVVIYLLLVPPPGV